jgi:hypothetical protein
LEKVLFFLAAGMVVGGLILTVKMYLGRVMINDMFVLQIWKSPLMIAVFLALALGSLGLWCEWAARRFDLEEQMRTQRNEAARKGLRVPLNTASGKSVSFSFSEFEPPYSRWKSFIRYKWVLALVFAGIMVVNFSSGMGFDHLSKALSGRRALLFPPAVQGMLILSVLYFIWMGMEMMMRNSLLLRQRRLEDLSSLYQQPVEEVEFEGASSLTVLRGAAAVIFGLGVLSGLYFLINVFNARPGATGQIVITGIAILAGSYSFLSLWPYGNWFARDLSLRQMEADFWQALWERAERAEQGSKEVENV